METGELPLKGNRLQPSEISRSLGQSIFAGNIFFYETLESTNSFAKALGRKNAPDGTIVLAEEQSAGKGRMGRTWLSAKHANLLFSLLVRPTMDVDQVFVLTMVLALAAIDAVEIMSDLHPMIKWPNDLYVQGKKLGGILTEFSAKGRKVDYVVLGLGLNVHWNPDEENGIVYPATNIMSETGSRVSREELLVRILKVFEHSYRQIDAGHINDFYERWNRRSILIGKRVEINTQDGRETGKAIRIDRNGALIILNESGKEKKILCGDVSVRHEYP